MAVVRPEVAHAAAELMVRCGNSDDPTVWSEFVKAFHRRILLYVVRERRAYGKLNDEADMVDELTQEVYLRLLANNRRALRDFQGRTEASVYAYLACVTRSVITDYMRRQSSQKRVVSLVSLDSEVKDEQ